MTCLTNNWQANRQKDIAKNFLDRSAFQWFDKNYAVFGQWYQNGVNNNLRDALITKYITIAMKNKWQIEYHNICQGSTETVDAYTARFRKAISKAKIGNLLPAQMQVMDFVAGLWSELAIITNGSNPADLDKAEKTAKNIESASLINKNVIGNYLKIVKEIGNPFIENQIISLLIKRISNALIVGKRITLSLNVKLN